MTATVCLSFSNICAGKNNEYALFTTPPMQDLFSTESSTTMASTASATYYAAYDHFVIVRIRRFANDTGVPHCRILRETNPLLECNWKKMFSKLFFEEALVVGKLTHYPLVSRSDSYLYDSI